jgi:transposase
MLSIHPQARTTPAIRIEIARSTEPTGVLAQRFSVSTETVRKWRKRGVQDCQDHSSRPHKLPWKATEEERAIVCALRQATGFPLDDLTFVVSHFLPHLNRDAVYRILKAEGLGRLPPAQQRKRKSGTFKDYDLGFIHIDIKHLPKLRTANGESRKRFLYVAIDRCSRWVHLAVKDDELATSAVAFLKEAVRAFPFKITHVLTDRGSCFTADAFEDACHQLKLEHRKTKPYTPQTTDVIDKSFFAATGVFSSRARVTLWQRAGLEVQTLPRSLYCRSSFRAPVRTFPDLGPRGFQPATNRA